MPTTLNNRLVVAISSRALFDLDASHAIYEHEPLAPGGFSFGTEATQFRGDVAGKFSFFDRLNFY